MHRKFDAKSGSNLVWSADALGYAGLSWDIFDGRLDSCTRREEGVSEMCSVWTCVSLMVASAIGPIHEYQAYANISRRAAIPPSRAGVVVI